MTMTTLEFLTQLYAELPENLYLYLWTLPDKTTRPFQDISSLPATYPTDTYFGLGATAQALQPNERAKSDQIQAIPGLWVDIDIQHPQAHKTQALPPDVTAAKALLPADLTPTIIVWSGYGIHVYYLFRESWVFDDAPERVRATKLLQALQGIVKHNAAQHGWRIDTTSDLSRILRLPGTQNYKLPDSPTPCYVLEYTSVRYNPTDIEDLLPPIPTTETDTRTEKFERRPTDGPADLMLRSCIFMQHIQLNASSITYDEWLAAITNLVRASDGIQAAHHVSAMDTARYDSKVTDKKINEALGMMNPQSCDYIRSVIGFTGCPSAGCDVQAPCGWSLGRVAQARSVVRSIPAPTPEIVLTPDVLGALAVLKKHDAAEYAKFKAGCKGQVNLNDLEKAVKNHRRQAKEQHLHVVQPGDRPGAVMLSSTVPTVPVDLALPPNFKFEESGILHLKQVNDSIQTYKAASTPVIISERIFNMDTQLEKLEIAFRYLNGWRRAVFPRSTVFDSRKILRLSDFGVSVSSESAKYLVKWFDSLADVNQGNIPVTHAVAKLGWRGDREFVMPTLSQQYRVDIDDDGSQSTVAGFTAAGSRDEWITRMRYLRQSPKARFILSASFAAPLLRILGQRNFIVHNWGSSQDGKTATLWAAMSVWGNPDQLIGTFDTTPTALERKAAIHNDLPLAINEREVLNKFRKNDINPLLYVLGEGRGRGRGTKTGLQHTATWRTVALSTGEGTLSNSGSLEGVMTRVLEVPDGPLAHDREFARGLYHFLPRCHGHIGAEFLSNLLATDYATVYATYREYQTNYRANCPDKIDSHIDAVACVATADYLSSGWIFGEPWDQARTGAGATGQHVLTDLATRLEASESERAWDAFIDWMAENEDKFSGRANGPRYGYREGPDTFVIRSIVDRFLTDNYSGARRIIKEWGLMGRIEAFNHGGKTRFDTRGKSMDGGFRPQVIKLRADH